MRVAVLGPLEVTANDNAPVQVPGARERLLLAVLAAQAPDVVPADRLVELLGDDEAVRAAVHGLRAALEPQLPGHSSGQFVLRRGRGYALVIPRADIDATRFTDLANRGHARLAQDPADAEWMLATALGLWRAEPFGEWPDEPFAVAERERLAELRSRAEADLGDARAAAPAVAPRRLATAVRQVAEIPVPAQRVDPPARVPAAPASAAAEAAPVPPAPPPVDLTVPAERPRSGRSLVLVGGLVVLLVVAMSVARLSGRSEQRTAEAATVADANQLAALSGFQTQLDVSILLAAEAYRLADTPATRDALARVLAGHERVQRAVSFYGVPTDAVLSGGRTLTFGVGVSVVGWPVGPGTVPREIITTPGPWADWLVAAPSPVDDVVLGAGMGRYGAWVRRISASDGASQLLVEGDPIGGQPVAGAMSPDGRTLHLLVARVENIDERTSRWQLVDVDAGNGAVHHTGIEGVVGSPVDRVGADFATDAGSFVVWNDDTPSPSGTLVQLADGRQVPLPVEPGTRGSRAFHAYPRGAIQLWDDGGVTLFDRSGNVVQEVVAGRPVFDVAVAPNGRWAVTGGKDGEVLSWEIDPATGRWYGRHPLRGHTGDVVSVEVDAPGRLLATVSVDHTAITWDMTDQSPRRGQGPADPEVRLQLACSIVGRDLTPIEWRRVLPDRPWEPTCSDVD